MTLPHIQLLQGRYHFRIRIPRDLRERFGRAELRRSLGTNDRAVAKRRGLRLCQEALALFDAVRRDPMLGREQIEAMARAFYALRLEEDRDARFAFGRAHAVDDAPAYPIDHAAHLERARRQLAFGDHRDILPRAQALLAASDGTLATGTRPLAEFCELLLRAELEAARRAVERDRGMFWGQPEDPLFREPAAAPPPAPPPALPAAGTTDDAAPRDARPAGLGAKAEEDIEALAEGAIAEKGLPEKMAEKYRAAAHAFSEVIGHRPVWRYTDDDVIHFKDVLLDTPARFNTQHGFGSLAEAAAENRRRRETRKADPGQPKPLPTISTKTINSNYLSPLRQIFAYAAVNKATLGRINVAAGVRAMGIGGERKQSGRDKRLPFAHDALVTLFGSPLFTGAHSAKRLFMTGTHLEAGWRFWLPLFMLLMGLRPNEIGQAEVCDVVVQRGWPCLRVTTDTAEDENRDGPAKRVKTGAGERTLPIHPELIRLGFLDLVEQRKAQGEARLFADWPAGCDGTYSMTSSKVFNRKNGYLHRVGLKSPRHALYSLRHAYKDSLRRSGLSDSQQNLLMGHEDGSVAGIYGSRELYAGLIRAVIDLDLDGITLDHVRPRFPVQPRTFQVGGMTVRIDDTVTISRRSADREPRA